MKNSYNPQEEVNELANRLAEMSEKFTKRIDELENALAQVQRALNEITLRTRDEEMRRRRTDIKVEDLQGTLAQKLKTLGELSKWDKRK